MENEVSIFWFRRDLRLVDNAGLYYALKNNTNILPLFIFDENILNKLEDKSDKRVEFIHRSLQEINDNLTKIGSSLMVLHGEPKKIFEKIIRDYLSLKYGKDKLITIMSQKLFNEIGKLKNCCTNTTFHSTHTKISAYLKNQK